MEIGYRFGGGGGGGCYTLVRQNVKVQYSLRQVLWQTNFWFNLLPVWTYSTDTKDK